MLVSTDGRWNGKATGGAGEDPPADASVKEEDSMAGSTSLAGRAILARKNI